MKKSKLHTAEPESAFPLAPQANSDGAASMEAAWLTFGGLRLPT